MFGRGSGRRFGVDGSGSLRPGGHRPEGPRLPRPSLQDRFLSTPPADDEDDRAQRIARERPVSPIYEGGDPFRVPRGDPPKLLRDKLYDRMCDWKFHGLAELDAWMPEREWVRAVLDLIHRGFAFDREGATIRLRKRVFGEHCQSIVELLSGFTLPDRIAVPEQDDSDDEDGEDEAPVDEVGFPPEQDDGVCEIPEAERMVLDEGGKLVVSVTEYVTDTVAILARRGMGKTYLAMLVAETFLASEYEIPFVVIDPTGCWYGLAATSDGKPSPQRIVIFGGEHGHRALASTSGRVLARLVAILRIPTIFDLSSLPSEEQHRFVADFASELYLHNREALHVFVDEADIFAPQKLDGGSKHQKRCLVALDNLTRRGRFRGIGDTLISQRPAVVNKNLLSQVGATFFLQMVSPQDLDAAMSWLHDNLRADVKRECRKNLPVLGKGTAYYLRGGDKSVFKLFKVAAKETFDSSYTPKMGEVAVVPELAKLSDEDAKAIDDFLANDVVSSAVERLQDQSVEEGDDES